MDISRKTLIIAAIINIVLIAICAVCLIVTNWNPVVLWISLAILVVVLITAIMTYFMGKNFKK